MNLSDEEASALGVGVGVDRQLTLVPGARVIRCKWHYDEAVERGEYLYDDVTATLWSYLFDAAAIAANVRLRDVLEMVQPHLPLIEHIIDNWSSEFIAEGLTNIKPWSGEYDPNGIEYLELYRSFEVESNENPGQPPVLESVDFLHFHGVGFELRDDSEHWGKGERIRWGVEYTHVNELADIPLRFNPVLVITDGRSPAALDPATRTIATYTSPLPRLIDLIHAIFWELSFAGPPAERDATKAEIDARQAEAQALHQGASND